MPDTLSPAEAVCRFLSVDPGEWEQLAPRFVRSVGQEELARVVADVRQLIGEVVEVSDGPDGLVVRGSTGQILAWARTAGDGAITALLLDGEPYRPPLVRMPPAVRSCLSIAIWTLMLGYGIWSCWTSSTLSAWLTAVIATGAGYVLFEGYGEPAAMPWWVRRPLEAGILAALASLQPARHLPFGHSLADACTMVLVLGGISSLLVKRRLHRWGAPLSEPLVFPLRDGVWHVGQGGGRSLNHHFGIPEQRGALDLVGLKPGGGSRRSGKSLDSYVCYGAKLYSPCDGRVVSAADDLSDQAPGLLRYGPLYGNHVFIDTGRELVKLAHLRSGSVQVTTGQTVQAGQLLGEVGNSGNTTEPHLRIHAEREGLGLDLEFVGMSGHFYRGRKIRT